MEILKQILEDNKHKIEPSGREDEFFQISLNKDPKNMLLIYVEKVKKMISSFSLDRMYDVSMDLLDKLKYFNQYIDLQEIKDAYDNSKNEVEFSFESYFKSILEIISNSLEQGIELNDKKKTEIKTFLHNLDQWDQYKD